MWLLNARKLKLEYFEGSQIPSYLILSHRWESEEVTFRDVNDKRHRFKKGWRKIRRFCSTAVATFGNDEHGNRQPVYCWIDTCCIDKSNSAELSEAINSMYQWYRDATACFAYLFDVVSDKEADAEAEFRNSVWFTRSWTLQELIAPREVWFFDHRWRYFGNQYDIGPIIAEITGIRLHCLYNRDLHKISVAEKMSWAANRHSTRIEDEAYSLLGIFDVNLPLIYGEGRRAFARLQEEILKLSNDQTVLAWGKAGLLPEGTQWYQYDFTPSAALYRHPDIVLEPFDLLNDRDVNRGNHDVANQVQPPTISGAGIAVSLYLIPHSRNVYFALVGMLLEPDDLTYFLDNESKEEIDFDLSDWEERRAERERARERREAGKCQRCKYGSKERHQCILIQRDDRDGHFRRCVADGSYIFDAPKHWQAYGRLCRVVLKRTVLCQVKLIHVPQNFTYGMQVESIHIKDVTHENITLMPYTVCKNQKALVMKVGSYGIAGTIVLTQPQKSLKLLLFGFDFDFNPFCVLVVPKQWDQRPQDVDFTIPDLDSKSWRVCENRDMVEVVGKMRASSKTSCETADVFIELHYGSWKDYITRFQISHVGQVELNSQAGGQLGLGIFIGPSTATEQDHTLDQIRAGRSGYMTVDYRIPPRHPTRTWDWTPRTLPSRSWAQIRPPMVVSTPKPLIEVLPDDFEPANIPRESKYVEPVFDSRNRFQCYVRRGLQADAGSGSSQNASSGYMSGPVESHDDSTETKATTSH